MKKQIFILVLIVIAAFLNVNMSFGQTAIAGPTKSRPTDCAGDALHPIAGNPYVYQAASNQAGNYTFWATKDLNLITTTGGVTTTNIATMLTTPTSLLTASANYGLTGATDNVTITWSDAILSATTPASPTLVAVNQQGTCTNNFKAWSIIPTMAFTVDITNIKNDTKASLAYDAATNQCFDVVRSAIFNAGSSTMEYDFGTQILYYEVIAANFTNSWTPTFVLSGLGNGQTTVIEWAYDVAFSAPVTTVTSGAASPSPVTTAVTNTKDGVSIYVRVTISNKTFEGIAATPITLAVDGQNSAGLWDVVNTPCTDPKAADQNDVAIQTLDPRPTITPVAPTPFVNTNVTN